MAYYQALPWHSGEDEIHKLTRVPHNDNPTHPMLSQNAASRVAASPTIALGTTDDDGRVWCTLWGGDLPIAQQVGRGVIGVKVSVDATHDPVVQTLYNGKNDGEVIRCEGKQARMVSGLSIHLEDRDRVKLFGRMVAGCLDAAESAELRDGAEDASGIAQATNSSKIGTAQLVLHITQSLGNCPKYINKKTIKSHPMSRPELASEGSQLSDEAISHIHSCDVFFVASRGPEDMDCNHRGGTPGFIRVQPQATADSPSTIVWPEYSGNNLYQTLGNILHDPSIGLCIPNLVTGDVMYVTGKAEILLDRAASSVISKTRLAVQLTIAQARLVKEGLMFRGTPSTDNRDKSSSKPIVSRDIKDGMSPYNPRVRYLTSELDTTNPNARFGTILPPDEYRARSSNTTQSNLTAKLTFKKQITPTIYRYTFQLSSSDRTTAIPPWNPGQYIALDFSDELYMGYSHMADNEPSSLNDDYIRTFTVASRHDNTAKPNTPVEFDIVIRNVGVVTRWLSYQNDRAGMTELKVLGFGGELNFDDDGGDGGAADGRGRDVFIAAGIGITPLLGHLRVKLAEDGKAVLERLTVLWTLHVRDAGLAVDVLSRLSEELKGRIVVFVTGLQEGDEMQVQALRDLREGNSGVRIENRRLSREDIAGIEACADGEVEVGRWFVCTGAKMREEVQRWIGEGKKVLFENFDY